MEGRRQLVSIELRAVLRPRDRAHVNDPLDGVRLQQTDEVRNRPSRVTDRENDQRSHVSSTTISVSRDGFQLLLLMTTPSVLFELHMPRH